MFGRKEKEIYIAQIFNSRLGWHYGLLSFQAGYTKLETFLLKRKVMKFEN